VTATRPLRIVVHDTAERGWPWLGVWWAIGARVLSGAGVVIGARSWEEAFRRIASAIRRNPGRPIDLQIWGHGYSGAPLIDGDGPHLLSFAHAIEGAPREGSTVWLRSCDVAEGPRGHSWMTQAVAALGVPIIAHCAVISLPYPWQQREICALRPGETVWWSLTGSELPACSTLRMRPPAFAFAPRAHP
jgi:hypothetical protein